MKSPLAIGDYVVVKGAGLRWSYAGISWDKRVMGRYIGKEAQVVGVYDLPQRHDAYILSIDSRRLQFGGENILWVPHWLEFKGHGGEHQAPTSSQQAANEIVQAQQRLSNALNWLGA